MRIKSRTAVEQYRDQTKDINVIGAELGVAFILEGSVRKAGENLRITAQLIDVKTGDHLWADTYDGKYTEEIFEFQSNTAKKIAASLNAVITPAEQKRIEQKPTTEIVAYDLCWRGIDMVDNYTRSKDRKYLESANYLFDKALEIDPKYLRAVYGKGHAFLMERNYDSAIFYADRVIELDPEDASGYFLKGSAMRNKPDLAIEYLLKAVELDPNNNWPNIMLGLAYYFGKNDVLKGLPYMNKALKLGGRAQPEIYNYIGYVFLSIGDYEKAKEYFKHALSLQTVCVGVFGYSLVLTVQGMFNETQHFLDSICNVSECDKNCYRLKFYGSLILKEYDQSEVYFNEFIEVEGIPSTRDSVRLAYVYKELGREQEALTILNNSRNSLENQLTESKTWRTYLPLSQIHAILDEKEKALEYLSEAAKLGLQRGYHDFILLDPTFENLWNDPEFKAIMKRAQDEKAAIRAQVRLMEERGELDL